MISLRRTALAVSVVMAILVINCCGGGPTFTPTPTVTSLSPDGAIAGGASFTLTVSGTGFETDSMVFWNGSCVTAAPPSTTCAPVTFNASTTQLSVTVPAAYIAKPGFPQITVVNPYPGGPSIVAATFTITVANNPVPTITLLSPSNTPVGQLPPNASITVNGTNFIQTSTVSFNGNPRVTQFVSATQLTATVLATDVATASGINVQVSNPMPGGGVSTGATFTVGPVPAVVPRASFLGAQLSAQLISVSASGGPANGGSVAPASSADGRFVAFYSQATNLVAGGASGNIFVRDTCTGAVSCTPQTSAVDLGVNGDSPATPSSEQVAISADGRFVTFNSSAANLVTGLDAAGQNSAAKVYIRDLCEGNAVPMGCTPNTELASVNSAGVSIGGTFAAISADGRFVAFESATPAGDSDSAVQPARIYVRDTCSGPTANSSCLPTTIEVQSNGASPYAQEALAISADGRYVAFTVYTSASATAGQQGSSAILLADTCEGLDAAPSCVPSTVSVSIGPDGLALPAYNALASLSEDGRFVAFESENGDSNSGSGTSTTQILLRDTCIGSTAPSGCTPSTTLVSDNAEVPSMSISGRYVAYIAAQTSTGTSNTSSAEGTVYVYDSCSGAIAPCTPSTYQAGTAAVDTSSPAPISSDGSLIAFASKSAIAPLPSSGEGDVYLVTTAH